MNGAAIGMLYLRVFFLIASSSFISSCSAGLTGDGSSYPGPKYEVIDRSEVVREEVIDQQTSFISNEDPSILWRRANLLATQYINQSTPPSILEHPHVRGFHVRHFPRAISENEKYGYEIAARATDDGTGNLAVKVDVVDLTTRSRNERSLMLAKNIARFMQTGTLERTFINP